MLSRLEAMLESYHKLQPWSKTVPEFKETHAAVWSAYRESH